jgi:hypothetical protein
MTETTKRDEREAFEAWYVREYERAPDPLRLADCGKWQAWQGCAESTAERLMTLERICAGVTDEMIEGGWTALGLSRHAKSLENKLAALATAPEQAGEPNEGAAPLEGCKHRVCHKGGACWEKGRCLDPIASTNRLTDEQIDEIATQFDEGKWFDWRPFARAIIAATEGK